MKIFFLSFILVLGLAGCNPNIDFEKIVPSDVDKFATGFISEIHKGNIDTCMTLILPEMNNENGRKYMSDTYSNIHTFLLDSFRIINARKTSFLGDNGFTNYEIDYEYFVTNKFLYFTFGIREKNGILIITAFDEKIMGESLSKLNMFSLKNKGGLHYIFLSLAILIPVFIIITLIFAIKTKLKKKWLWIIGILFGFIKFSINWTTGQIGFSFINISILGAGFTKSGTSAPWVLSFSLPIVALIFWYNRYWDKKEAELQQLLDNRIKAMENQPKNN